METLAQITQGRLMASRGIDSPATCYINDTLGATFAAVHPDRVEMVPMTAFGKPATAQRRSSGLIGNKLSPRTNPGLAGKIVKMNPIMRNLLPLLSALLIIGAPTVVRSEKAIPDNWKSCEFENVDFLRDWGSIAFFWKVDGEEFMISLYRSVDSPEGTPYELRKGDQHGMTRVDPSSREEKKIIKFVEKSISSMQPDNPSRRKLESLLLSIKDRYKHADLRLLFDHLP